MYWCHPAFAQTTVVAQTKAIVFGTADALNSFIISVSASSELVWAGAILSPTFIFFALHSRLLSRTLLYLNYYYHPYIACKLFQFTYFSHRLSSLDFSL